MSVDAHAKWCIRLRPSCVVTGEAACFLARGLAEPGAWRPPHEKEECSRADTLRRVCGLQHSAGHFPQQMRWKFPHAVPHATALNRNALRPVPYPAGGGLFPGAGRPCTPGARGARESWANLFSSPHSDARGTSLRAGRENEGPWKSDSLCGRAGVGGGQSGRHSSTTCRTSRNRVPPYHRPLQECVRAPADMALIEGTFLVGPELQQEVRELLAAAGLPARAVPPEPGSAEAAADAAEGWRLTVRREVRKQGVSLDAERRDGGWRAVKGMDGPFGALAAVKGQRLTCLEAMEMSGFDGVVLCENPRSLP